MSDRPLIDHHPRCTRRGAPVLIAGWDRTPLLQCPSCGRSTPAPDQRPTTVAATATTDNLTKEK